MKSLSLTISLLAPLMMLFISGCGSIRLGTQLRQLDALPVKQNGNTLSLLVNDHLLAVTAGSKVVMIDRIPVQLTEAAMLDEKKAWQIGDFPAVNILQPIVLEKRPPVKVILIDPGHGGKDNGAVSASGIKEKDLNLKLALLVAEELKKRGFTVSLTRTDDRYLSLDERPAMIARCKADLFISIHHNAAANKSAAGHEVYVINAKDAGQTLLLKNSTYTAFRIEKELSKVSRPARGVKLAGFKVQRLSAVPSILIEAGFVSNDTEVKLLASPEQQRKMACAIADAIAK